MQRSQLAAFKFELLHVKLRACLIVAQQSTRRDVAIGKALKIYGMEVHEIQYVADIDVLQLHLHGVCRLL